MTTLREQYNGLSVDILTKTLESPRISNKEKRLLIEVIAEKKGIKKEDVKYEVKQKELSKCDCCNIESECNEYGFNYGNLLSSQTTGGAPGTSMITTNKYQMSTNKLKGKICHNCIQSVRSKRSTGAFSFAIFAIISGITCFSLPDGPLSFTLLIIFFICAVLSIVQFKSAGEDEGAIGDDVLLKIHRKSFEDKGYDSFKTRSGYQN